MEMDFKRAGKEFQQIRKKIGLTQEQLAEKANITPNTVSRIERGMLVPSISTFIDICNALGTSSDVILASYIEANTQIRWSSLADKLGELSQEKQDKIQTILECLIDTI